MIVCAFVMGEKLPKNWQFAKFFAIFLWGGWVFEGALWVRAQNIASSAGGWACVGGGLFFAVEEIAGVAQAGYDVAVVVEHVVDVGGPHGGIDAVG